MRRFTDKTSWDGSHSSTLFTAATLEASGRHPALADVLNEHLVQWSALESKRAEAESAITRAHAQVAWADYALDVTVKAFANELLRDAGGKASDKTFRAFFDVAPSEIVKMALERELERLEAMWLVATKVKLSKRATAALEAMRAAAEEGSKRVAARREVVAKRALLAMDLTAWRERTDASRVSVHLQLQQWAIAHDDETSYAEQFFADTEPRAKRKSSPSEPPEST
ncbi:MAG: hypothetical protein Q8Q09_01605 [Deltaproteobacteria bacterium]|nr:hypothetical protein [Deltaproteobacteria bacterium]